MNISELESNMGMSSEVVDQYSDGDRRIVNVHVFSIPAVRSDFRQTHARYRALEVFGLTDGTIESPGAHFTDDFVHTKTDIEHMESITDRDYLEQQVPDYLLDGDAITVDDIELMGYTVVIDEALIRS